jgi:transcriptional regulator with XRE-family HTH domain
MNFGKRLKKLRDDKDLSQSELGKLTGLHYTQIGRYEKNKSMPSSDILQKLAEIFSVSIDFLIEGTVEEAAKSHIHDRELLKQFEQIEMLDEKEKDVVKVFLDAFITKKQLQKLAK